MLMSMFGRNQGKTSKNPDFPFVLLWNLFLLFPPFKMLEAKDRSTFGTTFVVQEMSLLELMMSRLQLLEEKDTLKHHQQRIAQQATHRALNPQPVDDLKQAIKFRTWIFDPSITLTQDVTDHHGKTLITKGKTFNPLSQMELSRPLVFFDGEDEAQRAWVHQHHLESKLILVRGQPLALSKEWEKRIYFDQEGRLSRKLNINFVPAVVFQEGLFLKIQEVVMGDRS